MLREYVIQQNRKCFVEGRIKIQFIVYRIQQSIQTFRGVNVVMNTINFYSWIKVKSVK